MSKFIVRVVLIVLCAFDAVTALVSAVLVVPTLPREWLRAGPFTDFTMPAIALGTVGIVSLVAVLALVSAPRIGALVAIVAGFAMVCFEIVEVAVVGIALVAYPNEPASWLQPFYFVVGVAVTLLGLTMLRSDEPRQGVRTTMTARAS